LNPNKNEDNAENVEEGEAPIILDKISSVHIDAYQKKANCSNSWATIKDVFEKAIQNKEITYGQLIDGLNGEIAPGTNPWKFITSIAVPKKAEPETPWAVPPPGTYK